MTSLTQEIASPKETTYKVKAGDSLSGIAQKTKVSVEELKKLNPKIKDDKIFVGQELKLAAS